MSWIKFIILWLVPAKLIMALPAGFVYLHDVDPSIVQNLKYDTQDNFIGRPIKGYQADECILTDKAAKALHQVQEQLQSTSLGLMVYDCYRPQQAVNDFIQWSRDVTDQKMKKSYYPRVNKADFFKLGYVAKKSAHTRGSTVDLTIMQLDMGTHFDYMDLASHPASQLVSKKIQANRLLFATVMQQAGFVPTKTEWWHFTLKDEPHPNTYFNFPVVAKIVSQSQQLITVMTPTWKAANGKLQRYQRNSIDGNWSKVGEPIAIVIGKEGIAWDNHLYRQGWPGPIEQEGDGRTPMGVFKIGPAFGFELEERMKLNYVKLSDTSVCVDDQESKYYNQLVDSAKIIDQDWHSAEKMRSIPFYRWGSVTQINPLRIAGAGSCVFLHIWRSASQGTAGCVATDQKDVQQILNWLDPNKKPVMVMLTRAASPYVAITDGTI